MGANNTRESFPDITRNGTPQGNTSRENTSQETTSRESICQDIESAYNSHTNEDDKVLGETFREASLALKDLPKTLRSLPLRGQESWTDALSRTARMTKTVYDSVTKAPNAKKLDVYKMAIRQVSDGMTVEAMVIGMIKHICDAAENDPSKSSMEDEIRQLRDKIDKLSQMESSIPKERHDFVARDNAHQFSVLGGDQNNNLGPGNQFFRNHINGGINFGGR
ncbi:hypothetical protein F4680DRAFT_424424 [Xylaria scruposa]|nr:hypothetical protein F4680DRAFT_424424 [Xylaria scruposa]